MTHDEIQKAAHDRIAEIDAQIATLTAERAKLRAMLDGADKKIGAEAIADALRKIAESGTPWPQPVYIPTPFQVYPEPHYPGLGQTRIEVKPYASTTVGTVTISSADSVQTPPPYVTTSLSTLSGGDVVCGGTRIPHRGQRYTS